MNNANLQKGAISTGAIMGIVLAIIVIIGLAFWFSTGTLPGLNPNGEATTTSDGTNTNNNSDTSTVTDNPTKGTKTYKNFRFGYTLEFPPDAQNNISNPENVIFSYDNGTTTADATLKITTGVDVTHLAYCLTVPQGATAVATTTINGIAFLRYTTSATTAANTGTTYYRTLHEAPYGKTCYDIQKTAQGSTTLNTKLTNILNSFDFTTF